MPVEQEPVVVGVDFETHRPRNLRRRAHGGRAGDTSEDEVETDVGEEVQA
jgi:hypothetical protein